MKKLSLVLVVFAFLPAFTLVENQPASQVMLNGHALGNAVVLKGGIIAVSLEDFARAAGAPVTLEPTLELLGNRLYAHAVSSGGDIKQGMAKVTERAAAPTLKQPGAVHDDWETNKIKVGAGQIIAIRKAGLISSNVIMVNGKAFVPLQDIISAFGDGSVRGFRPGNHKPGKMIMLNSNTHIQGILVGL